MQLLLNERNLDILFYIARYDVLTTAQIQRKFFPNAKDHRTTFNVLKRLAKYHNENDPAFFGKYNGKSSANHFCESVKVEIKTRDERTTTHKRFWYIMPKCQRNLLNYLEKNGHGDALIKFSEQFKTFNKNKTFSAMHLDHETRINDILFYAERDAERDPTIESIGWFRTSPRHEFTELAVKAELTAKAGKHKGKKIIRELPFNPDAVIWHRLKSGVYHFFFLEFENNAIDPTTRARKYRDTKLTCYKAYSEQDLFSELCPRLNKAFNLGLQNPQNATFRLLTVTRTIHHMQDVLAESRHFDDTDLFYFSHLEALEANYFSGGWYRKKELLETPYYEEGKDKQPTLDDHGNPITHGSYLEKYNDLSENALDPVRRSWFREQLQIKPDLKTSLLA